MTDAIAPSSDDIRHEYFVSDNDCWQRVEKDEWDRWRGKKRHDRSTVVEITLPPIDEEAEERING